MKLTYIPMALMVFSLISCGSADSDDTEPTPEPSTSPSPATPTPSTPSPSTPAPTPTPSPSPTPSPVDDNDGLSQDVVDQLENFGLATNQLKVDEDASFSTNYTLSVNVNKSDLRDHRVFFNLCELTEGTTRLDLDRCLVSTVLDQGRYEQSFEVSNALTTLGSEIMYIQNNAVVNEPVELHEGLSHLSPNVTLD